MTTSAQNANPNANEDAKKLERRLYDKLWENVIGKENRVWTFLAVYGAAVGLAIGTDATKDIRFETAFVILLLTYWVSEIILDADWWSVRNRAMIGGIERKNPQGTAGVIPSTYASPYYSTEDLNNVSIAVMAIVGLAFLGKGIHLTDSWDVSNRIELVGVCFLYCAYVLGVGMCCWRREGHISAYYDVLTDLNKQDPQLIERRFEDNALENARLRDLRCFSWKIQGLALYLLATGMICVRLYRSKFLLGMFTFAGIHVVLGIILFLLFWKYLPKTKRLMSLVVLLFLTSFVFVALPAPAQGGLAWFRASKPTEPLDELVKVAGRLEDDFRLFSTNTQGTLNLTKTAVNDLVKSQEDSRSRLSNEWKSKAEALSNAIHLTLTQTEGQLGDLLWRGTNFSNQMSAVAGQTEGIEKSLTNIENQLNRIEVRLEQIGTGKK